MTARGTVTATDIDWAGDSLRLPAVATDEVLHVYSVIDFDDEGGGWFVADGIDPAEYLSADEDAGTVALAAPLGVDLPVDTPIFTYDPDAPASEKRTLWHRGTVQLHDDAGTATFTILDDRVITAGVDNLLGASVQIVEADPDDDTDDEWVLGRVYGRESVLDLSNADPTTAPPGLGGGSAGQTVSTEPPPASTDGYSEDHIWWQVVGGEQVGAWYVSAGAWVPLDVVSADALVGKTYRTAVSGRRIVIVGDDAAIPGDAQEIRFYDEADAIAARVWVSSSALLMQAEDILTLLSGGSASLNSGTGDVWVHSDSASACLFSGTGPYGGFSTTRSAVVAGDDGIVRLTSMSSVFGGTLVSLLAASSEIGGGPVGVTLSAVDSAGDPVPLSAPQVIQRGAVSSGALVANTTKDVSVTFPTEFDAVPTVTISVTGVSNPLNFGVATTDITTTGFTARFIRSTGTAEVTAHWSAGPAD